jgi:putative PIN family toxin of toxin-antitoxin system
VRRVTADSNIYISALNFGGKPLQILELARAGQIELAISNAILTETSRILRDKFHWEPEDIDEAVEQILRFTEYVHVDSTLDVVPTDPDDNRVLECALMATSDTVVTGDTDLLVMGSFRGIRIQKPSDFLASFQPSRR